MIATFIFMMRQIEKNLMTWIVYIRYDYQSLIAFEYHSI